MTLGATPSALGKGMFVWTKGQIVNGTVTCFLDQPRTIKTT